MKLHPRLSSFATLCLLAFAPAQAATIISSQVWVTYSDVESTYGAIASPAYDGSEINVNQAWKGGSITIQLEEGETLISAFVTGTTTFSQPPGFDYMAPITHSIPVYAGVSGSSSGPSTITLDVWKTGPSGETNPKNFAQFYAFPWAPPQMRTFETSVSFTIETNLGTYHDNNGGSGYTAAFPIPEPSSALLAILGMLPVFRRKR